jgi:hypothetical protein
MHRKTSLLPTRVWAYECQPPGEKARAQILDQLQKANAYYNQLIALDLDRRTKYRAARAEFPEVGALEATYKELGQKIDQVRDVLKAARAKARKRVDAGVGDAAALKALKAERKTVKAELDRVRLLVAKSAPLKALSQRNLRGRAPRGAQSVRRLLGHVSPRGGGGAERVWRAHRP